MKRYFYRNTNIIKQYDHPAFVNRAPINSKDCSDELKGLRLAVKDLFHIAGLPTAAGNPDWLATHAVPSATNTCVMKLISMGAEYVGKTLSDELAYSLNGQNIHYPALINPKTPERLPGGSTSGSAVAVAEDLADIGLGTDTGGSIRVPASYNGLYGLRTTHSAIETDNMVALAPSFDTVGWLTSNIDVLERVATAILPKPQDTKAQSATSLLLLTNLIDECEQASNIYDWVNSLSEIPLHKATLDLNELNSSETFRVLQGYEIWQQHGEWITNSQASFAPDIKARFLWCEQLTKLQQSQAYEQQLRICKTVLALFNNNDVILIPTTPGRAPLLSEPAASMVKYREELMALTSIAGLVGLPQLHLPLFEINGAPCGLSLIGKKNSDLALIAFARKCMSANMPEQIK